MRHTLTQLPSRIVPLVAAGFLMGAGGDDDGGRGCGAVFSESDAPDMAGEWRVDYDDTLDVEIAIGGAVYHETIGVQGGVIEIEHDGQPFTFDLDCNDPDVVCPSEAWPQTVSIEQRNEKFQHQAIVNLPTQTCSTELRAPEPSECGEGTENPDCDDICDGRLVVENKEKFGVISEDGTYFDILLGAGAATNGINCALLGVSVAQAELVTTQTRNDWTAEEMDNGEVITAYAGGCLWADDVDGDSELEALALGATIKFTTGFVAERQ